MVATPAPKRRANKRKQTKTGGEPSGLEEEGRGSPGQGNGVPLVNASGLETGNGSGEGVEGQSGGRREQSCSLGQIFCCFISFSVNQLVFARTGYAGSVEERRAREETRKTGMASCPGLHFAVIICTNSS